MKFSDKLKKIINSRLYFEEKAYRKLEEHEIVEIDDIAEFKSIGGDGISLKQFIKIEKHNQHGIPVRAIRVHNLDMLWMWRKI